MLAEITAAAEALRALMRMLRLLKGRAPDDPVHEAALELVLTWKDDLDEFCEAVAEDDGQRVADLLAALERRQLLDRAAGAGDAHPSDASDSG